MQRTAVTHVTAQHTALAREPLVITGLADAWPARHWSLSELASHFGDVAVDVATVTAGRVVIDARRGVVTEKATLASVVAALADGSLAGLVTTRLDGLPRALRAVFPPPAPCRDAGRRVSKLWISPADTVSALHFDLSDNLHTVLHGRKRFTLFSPRARRQVYPYGLFSALPNGSRVDPETPDLARFPRLATAHARVADVGAGETLYLPRGWWHHVRTLEPSLAVNTWWADGAWRWVVAGAEAFKRARGVSV